VADQRADILENVEMRRRSNAPIAFDLQFGHGKNRVFYKTQFFVFHQRAESVRARNYATKRADGKFLALLWE
jgi:hypothetical protein